MNKKDIRAYKANLRKLLREEAKKIVRGLTVTVDAFVEALLHNGGKAEKKPSPGDVRRFVRKLDENKSK